MPGRQKALASGSDSDSDQAFHDASSNPPAQGRTGDTKQGGLGKKGIKRARASIVAMPTIVRPVPSLPAPTGTGTGQDPTLGRVGLDQGKGEGAPALTLDTEALSKFENWMKMATDNKITSGNSWDLALIDYFADLSILRDGSDQSINFQKASCTLDGCVKIWTSRVDSVGIEAGKLAGGLIDGLLFSFLAEVERITRRY